MLCSPVTQSHTHLHQLAYCVDSFNELCSFICTIFTSLLLQLHANFIHHHYHQQTRPDYFVIGLLLLLLLLLLYVCHAIAAVFIVMSAVISLSCLCRQQQQAATFVHRPLYNFRQTRQFEECLVLLLTCLAAYLIRC